MCQLQMFTDLASTALSMTGMFNQQKLREDSLKDAAKAQIQMAENQMATQRALARQEIQKGNADRERQQRQAQKELGQMRANMGASGFEMDTGSNVSLLAESAAEHQDVSNQIMQDANQAAWQRENAAVDVMNSLSQAKYDKKHAGDGWGNTYLDMGKSLLGRIGSAAKPWDKKMNAPANPFV